MGEKAPKVNYRTSVPASEAFASPMRGSSLRHEKRAFALIVIAAFGLIAAGPVDSYSKSELPCPEGTTAAWLTPSTEDARWISKEAGCVRPDGRLDGPVLSWSGSRIARVRHFRDGALDGTAVSWHPTGSVEVVQSYSQGKPFGTARIWSESGDLRYEIRYQPDGRTEIGRTLHMDGSMRSSYMTVDGEMHGEYRSWFPSGELHSQGHYENGRKHGTWTCRSQAGAKTITMSFIRGQRDAKDTGEVEKREFDECLLAVDGEDSTTVSSR